MQQRPVSPPTFSSVAPDTRPNCEATWSALGPLSWSPDPALVLESVPPPHAASGRAIAASAAAAILEQTVIVRLPLYGVDRAVADLPHRTELKSKGR
jgi:hypothetical protein